MGAKGPRDKLNSPLKRRPVGPPSPSSEEGGRGPRRSTRLKKAPPAPDRGTRDGQAEGDGQTEPNIDGEALVEEVEPEPQLQQEEALVAVTPAEPSAAVVVPTDSEDENTALVDAETKKNHCETKKKTKERADNE